MGTKITLGSTYLGNGQCRFRVWAPLAQKAEVHIVSPEERRVPLRRDANGYHSGSPQDTEAGSLYFYDLDGEKERPDPASQYQPGDVHGPSQVWDHAFPWEDSSWFGIPLQDYILYELHVGTFTPEGTFDAIIPHLDALKDLGVTVLELMPVSQFPGERNWGYDGAYPFAVQASYGGPDGLKRLVNACHLKGMAVCLDVVYNHLGPEGNYFRDFAPYFTDSYKTPWGASVNFDGPGSDEVRRFFLENALYWTRVFHLDALRLDAVHAILDFSAYTFLEELAHTIQQEAIRLNRRIYLIPESALNDTRIIRPPELGGYGLDAQWNDDFHHALHTLLTGEQEGYYMDYGALSQFVKALREGYVLSGDYSVFRQRRHGNSSAGVPPYRLVVFSQNHDQVGNRIFGDRLAALVSPEGLKLAAGCVILSPFIPLIFMGEEYGETSPFPYFVSHSDPELVEAVRKGRREEFSSFTWEKEPPDPQDVSTFASAKLDHGLRSRDPHLSLYKFYFELITLRKKTGALARLSKEEMRVGSLDSDKVVWMHRWCDRDEAFCVFYFKADTATVSIPMPAGIWERRLDSSDQPWAGPGSSIPLRVESNGEVPLDLSPLSTVVFVREKES